MLSRDPDFVLSLPDIDLVHRVISARMYRAMVEGARRARNQRPRLPLLLMHGTSDPVTSFEATARFCEQVGANAEFHTFPGALHELHNDLCRDDVLRTAIAWLKKQAR